MHIIALEVCNYSLSGSVSLPLSFPLSRLWYPVTGSTRPSISCWVQLIRPLHLLSRAWVRAGSVLTTAPSHWARTRIPGPPQPSPPGRPTDRTGRGWRKETAPVLRQSTAHTTGQNGRGPAGRDGDGCIVGQLVKEERRPDGKKDASLMAEKLRSLSLLSRFGNQFWCVNDANTRENTHKHTLVTFNRGNTLVIIFQQEVWSGWMVYNFDKV